MKYTDVIFSKVFLLTNLAWLLLTVFLGFKLASTSIALVRKTSEYDKLKSDLAVQAAEFKAKVSDLTLELHEANAKLDQEVEPVVQVRERIVKDFVSTPGGGLSAAGVEALNRMQGAK